MPPRSSARSIPMVFACSLISLLAVPALRADTVVLKNGDRLTGTAVKLDGGKLTFKTDYADAIAIAWDQVTSLTTAKPLVLPTAKGNLSVVLNRARRHRPDRRHGIRPGNVGPRRRDYSSHARRSAGL